MNMNYTYRYLCLLCLLFSITACNGAGEEVNTQATNSSGDSSGGSKKLRWNSSNFPLNVSLSSEFSASERSHIIDMTSEWNVVGSGFTTFFNVNSSPTTDPDHQDIDDYTDGTLGVYISNGEVKALPKEALAITVISGVEKSDYIEIRHADIFFNKQDWSFTVDENVTNKYDLPSVALHEFGHFLGLGHTDSSVEECSVMLPSISTGDVKRSPCQYDEESMIDNYTSSSSSAILAYEAEEASYAAPEEAEEEKLVAVIMEHYPDGRCVHKKNGKTQYTHYIEKIKEKLRARK